MFTIKQNICLFVAQVCMFCLIHSTADAANGFVTTNEATVDAIYKQSNFGANFIDIRFNDPLQILNSNYLNIDSKSQLTDLINLSNKLYHPSSPTIPMFFVDQINFCDDSTTPPGSNFIGCSITLLSSDRAGTYALINSSFGAGALGGNLIAHEIGHTLGLDHLNGTPNLMNSIIYSGNSPAPLTDTQVNSLLKSPFIQMDENNQRFVQISPFAIVASVPEPSTWLLLIIGGLWISFKTKRAKLPRVFDFN